MINPFKTKKRAAVYAKSVWKCKVRKRLNKLGKVFEDAYYGRRPDMYDMLDEVDFLVIDGNKGVDINTTLVDLQFSKHAIQDLRKVLRKIEVTSKHLIEVLEKFGMPVADMTQFVNPLVHDLADPITSYEDLMSTKDREAK